MINWTLLKLKTPSHFFFKKAVKKGKDKAQTERNYS